MKNTPLDKAFAAMTPEDDADADVTRRAYYAALLRAELHLALDEPPENELTPSLIETDGARFALAFDTAERVVEFTQGEAHSAVMAGRDALALLGPARLGLGVNLGVAPSAYMLPADTLTWILGCAPAPAPALSNLNEVALPHVEAPFLHALDLCLAGLAGQARKAYFAQIPPAAPVLLFEDAQAPAGLDHAMREFFAIMGANAPHVIFDDHPEAEAVKQVGLSFVLPLPPEPVIPGQNPGLDPSKPPKLR